MTKRAHWHWFLMLLGCWVCLGARAQIDPEKRRTVQLGYNQPIEGRGPIAGYAFYYINDPGFLRTNLTLRLAIAPVYLDSELGIREALGPHTDLGIGLAGGGFADSYSEIRGGKFFREESFTGHGANVESSVYHLFNPESRIPLYGIGRVGAHYSIYARDANTDPAFAEPRDQTTFSVRTGLRWGGREPVMMPALAMEMSVWYEGQFRMEPGSYGYNGDREVEPNSHLFWARGLGAYTLPEWGHNISLSLTAGMSADADRLSAYRLGGMLPMISEFPLGLPGYYFQELTAERFLLLDMQYNLPLNHAKTLSLTAFGGTGLVDYLPGLEQPGHWHTGVGGGLSYQSPSHSWMAVLGYGHAIDAIRSDGRGANTIGIFCQFDLESRYREHPETVKPPINPNKFRGFDWLLGR